MSNSIKIILAGVVGVLIGASCLIILRTTQVQPLKVGFDGQASGTGVPTVFDNVNTSGSIVTNVTQGNPLVMPTGLVGSIYAGNTLTQGGVQTVSTSSSGTLTMAQIDAATMIYSPLAATGAITLTLPATSTLALFVPNLGDCQQLVINSASTTAGLLTLAGNTGVNLRTGSTTSAIVGGGDGVIDFCRIGGNQIDAILDAQVH